MPIFWVNPYWNFLLYSLLHLITSLCLSVYTRQCNTLQRYLTKKWHPLFTPIFSQAFLIGDVLISESIFFHWLTTLSRPSGSTTWSTSRGGSSTRWRWPVSRWRITGRCWCQPVVRMRIRSGQSLHFMWLEETSDPILFGTGQFYLFAR